MEKTTDRGCGQGAGPSAGSQAGKAKDRGAYHLLNLQRWMAPPVLKLKTRNAEVKASQQLLLGAAAMDGSATPIHTEEGRLAKRPPPSKGGLGWS